MNLYSKIMIDNMLRFILLFASFLEIVKGFFKYDLLEKLDTIRYMKNVKYLFYTLIMIAFFINITKLTYYLPFLGKTAFPTGLLNESKPNRSNFSFTVTNTKPNTKIVYWGSQNEQNQTLPISTPWDAYKKYENSGVTFSDKNGKALFQLVKPVEYKIPNGNTLPSHVHYRQVLKDGMLGPVETVNI